jgi:hypothetical protein
MGRLATGFGLGFVFGAVTTTSGMVAAGAVPPLFCAKLFGVTARASVAQSGAATSLRGRRIRHHRSTTASFHTTTPNASSERQTSGK